MAPRPSLLSIASHFFLPRFPLSDTRTELVQTEEEDGLVDLEAQDGGLDEAQGLAVDLDEALARLAVRDSSGGLLLAEALDGLNGRHFCDCVTKRSVGRSIRSRRASLGWSSVGSIFALRYGILECACFANSPSLARAGGPETPTFQRLKDHPL